jgi:hypothetical protein
MCIEGYIGDPFFECRLKPLRKYNLILLVYYRYCTVQQCCDSGPVSSGPFC